MKGRGSNRSASSVRERSTKEFVFCSEETVPRKAFRRKGATHFVVADFRPRSERAEDIELGRAAANTVDRLLRDYMVRVAMEGEDTYEQAQESKELEVYRLRCVIRDATAALAIGEAMGADLLLWGDAVCPLRQGQGVRLVNIITTIEAKDNSQIHTGQIAADVELPRVETGSFCARASMTASGWPMLGSGDEEARSASVLELGNLDLPQVVAGDALGLTLFVGGLHFYKRNNYPRALRLFRSASETLRTDSRSAAELLQVMGSTELQAGRFDRAADYFSRCESLAKADSAIWWTCRPMQVMAHVLASHITQARELAEDALQRARLTGRREAEAISLVCLGVLFLHVSDTKEARARFAEALSLNQLIGSQAELLPLSGLEEETSSTSELKAAKVRYEAELPLYRLLGFRFKEALTLMSLGDLSLRLSELKEAREWYEQALRLHRNIGFRMVEAVTLKKLGDVALRTSELKKARARYEEALLISRDVGSPLLEAEAVRGLGDAAMFASEMKEARTRYTEALAMFRTTGSRLGEANSQFCLGEVALYASELKEARARFAEALLLYRSSSSTIGEAHTLRSQGDLALRMSESKEARERFAEALTLYRTAHYSLGEAKVLWSQGDLAFRVSEMKEAREKYEQSLALYRANSFQLGEALALQRQGDLALRMSEMKEAREKYEGALKLFQDIGNLQGEASARLGLGQLAEAQGHGDEAAAAYQQARSSFERTECRYCLVGVDWHYALNLFKRGEIRQAREVLTRAHQAAVGLGETTLASEVQASLDALDGKAHP
ncbi:tetratricopeptide repeat protein [Archangium violaceum]|uniref:tetratricopeptide repeat protein n=1 Tax=Archangium violaceum TaxID=83451 RepID=UPI0036DDFCB5